ncbi:permease-like cell division protein FtsX [Paraoerskovia marina]|uniref:Cell division protein FtsX n=1 Tax=Paraoerskovia marina TaxID=545619 RepID=A0A1H1UGF5_9CELL|nr:permease-like cell division protein FtsX [Paraoerskovia marina]SDS71614.1 cell division transport system permease protein [Paraoerskovia marina]
MRGQFILGEVGAGLRRNLSMTVAVVLVTFVSLTFVGAAALLQLQIDKLQGDWYEQVEVTVYLCPQDSPQAACAGGEATQEQQEDLERVIATELDGVVEEVRVESKEDAFDAFTQRYPDGYLGTPLTVDDMQSSLHLTLVDPEEYEVVNDVLTGRPGVESVEDDRAIFEPLFLVLNRLSLLAAGLAVVMLVTAVLLISTTIRLSAFSRRRETSIMRLVGASNTVIQLPFLLEGAIAAVLGSLLAIGGLLVGVRYLITDWLAGSVPWVNYVDTGDVIQVAPFLILIALVLSVGSSYLTLRRYTRV